MRRSSKPLPKDPNQLAYEVVRLSTEETNAAKRPSLDSALSRYLSEIGRKGGLKGGNARAKQLSAKKRRDIARKAAKARWKKRSP